MPIQSTCQVPFCRHVGPVLSCNPAYDQGMRGGLSSSDFKVFSRKIDNVRRAFLTVYHALAGSQPNSRPARKFVLPGFMRHAHFRYNHRHF